MSQPRASRQDLVAYVHLLRFGPDPIDPPTRVFATLRDIARLLRLSVEQVRRLLSIDLKKNDAIQDVAIGRPPKLRPEHISFLTSPFTLQKWACKTLVERVVLFHRSFPEIKISPRTLCEIYRRNKVSRKALRYVKKKKSEDPEKTNMLLDQIRQRLSVAKKQGKRIIFTDEAMFTTATLPKEAYAAKGENVCLNEKLASSPAVAVVAGVSAERGLEGFFIKDRSIDSDAFIQYLLILQQADQSSSFILFMDNCRVHHSKKVAKFLEENKIEAVFNIPYGPEYNPIERVWAQLKAEFKKRKMAAILEETVPNYPKLIRAIMSSYPPEKIQSICRKTSTSMLRI